MIPIISHIDDAIIRGVGVHAGTYACPIPVPQRPKVPGDLGRARKECQDSSGPPREKITRGVATNSHILMLRPCKIPTWNAESRPCSCIRANATLLNYPNE
eukprot:9495035-Pyramimonas_sp.AAC.1